MIPKIGQTIYVVFNGNVYKEHVYMLGEKSFIHESIFDPCCLEEYRQELLYEDYNKVWFTSLKEAKNGI